MRVLINLIVFAAAAAAQPAAAQPAAAPPAAAPPRPTPTPPYPDVTAQVSLACQAVGLGRLCMVQGGNPTRFDIVAAETQMNIAIATWTNYDKNYSIPGRNMLLVFLKVAKSQLELAEDSNSYEALTAKWNMSNAYNIAAGPPPYGAGPKIVDAVLEWWEKNHRLKR